MNIALNKTTKLMVILAAVFTSIALCFLFTQNAKANEGELQSDSAAVSESSASVSADSSQAKLIELTKKYENRVIWFVPAFKDGTANTYLKDIKFYNANKQEITDITKAIAETSEAGRLTMNRLYADFMKSSDVNKVPAYVSNSGDKITFYGVIDARWDDVFESNGYKDGSWFYKYILDDDAGIGTVYFDGIKDNVVSRSEGNWAYKNSDCPTINGVSYSNHNEGTSTFYEAYGGKDGGFLSASSHRVWSSHKLSHSGCDWNVANTKGNNRGADYWDTGDLDCYRGVVLTKDIEISSAPLTNAPLTKLTKNYEKRTIWFVPAFADGTANTYLKDIKFYNANKQEIIEITKAIADTSEAGRLTMNRLYTNFIKSSDPNKVPAYVSNSGTDITFYGVTDSRWDDVFLKKKVNSKWTAIRDYNSDSWFYDKILDAFSLGTVYFDGDKVSTQVSSIGNWTKGEGSCPTLNGVSYSNHNEGTNTFFEAYGGNNGGVLSSSAHRVWTPTSKCTEIPVFTNVNYMAKDWNVANTKGNNRGADYWDTGDLDCYRGVVLTKNINGSKVPLIKQYEKRRIMFVPAFKDGTANTYLKDIKFYNANKQEITEITKAIADTSEAGRLTMNRLYTNFIKSSDVNKVPAYVSNSGPKITFYGVTDARWDDVFEEINETKRYNSTSWFYKNILSNKNNIGTVYFDGTKTSPWNSTIGNWTNGSGSCPTLNGVNYSNHNEGTSTFFEAYGRDDGGVLSSGAHRVWTSCRFENFNVRGHSLIKAKNWCIANAIDNKEGDDYWDSGNLDCYRGVVLTKTF